MYLGGNSRRVPLLVATNNKKHKGLGTQHGSLLDKNGHISLVICVSLPGKHIDLVICVLG